MLTLSEKLFLALHLNKKEACTDLSSKKRSQLIAAGGMIVELLLAGHLRLDKNRLVVVDSSLTGDELLDEVLHRLHPAVHFNANDDDWFDAIAQHVALSDQLLARIFKKEVIRPFPEHRQHDPSQTVIYPLQYGDIAARWQQLQKDILFYGGQTTVDDVVLLFMVVAWNTPLPNALPRQEQNATIAGWERLFCDFFNAFPVSHTSKPSSCFDPVVRKAIGQLTISWVNIKASDSASKCVVENLQVA